MNLLVAESSLTTASRPVWEGLCDRVWTDDELIRIEQLLEEMNFAITMLKVIRLERAMICSVLVDQKKFSAFLENQSSIAWFAWYVRLAPRGWGYRNAVTYGRVVQDALLTEQGMQVKRLSITNVQSYARKAVEIRKPPLHPYTVTAGIGMTAYAELFMRAIAAQGTINNARVAIALERYRLRHGEYPEEIDALQPEFLREAPADIVTGDSLRYLLRADGRPCIYSVGINRIDDGGQPREDRSLGDWVWQYSMPDGFEIEHFFEKP